MRNCRVSARRFHADHERKADAECQRADVGMGMGLAFGNQLFPSLESENQRIQNLFDYEFN